MNNQKNLTELVQKLRNISGAGILECKKALQESDFDIEKALILLREKGATKALSKTTRVAKNGVIASYIHSGEKIGVLLELNCETDFVARTDEFKSLAKEICLQIAACNPRWIKKEDVPEEIIRKEIEIYKKQILQDEKNKNKPTEVIDKIVQSRLEKFYEETCLLEQPYIRDAQGKQKVKDLLLSVISKVGENINIKRFTRYVLGEE